MYLKEHRVYCKPWNDIPSKIRIIESKEEFSNRIKNYSFEQHNQNVNQ